ncbi:MFS transporter [Bacillus songklensis]|uniref:MFS transporter n=1 Tax=Bacillus songklensis TaxID=1069116 RepID=A0ABV8B928_9BACI
MSTHIISVIVKNQPGVLAQLSDLFGRPGYNIEKIKARNHRSSDLTKIKIAATIGEEQLVSILEQVRMLSPVVDVDANAQRRFSFWLVAYCLFITLLGTNLPAPLYALYRAEWQLSSGMMTFMYALYALIVIPTIITVGQISKRIGRKRVLLTGVFCSILGSIGFALSHGVNGLLLSRLLQGLSVGILNGVAVDAMTRFHDQQDKVKSAFIAAIAGTLGNALAPLISGYLGEYAPYPMQLSYLTHISLAIVGMVGLCFILEKKAVSERSLPIQLPSIPKDLQEPFTLSASTSFLSWAIMSLMLSVMPTYLNLFISTSSLSLSGTMVALVLGLSTIHQIILKRHPSFRIIAIGNVFLVLGLAGMLVTLFTNSLFFLILTTVFIGLGNGPSYAGSLVYINQVSPDERRANIVSSFFVVTYLGISIPVLTLGCIGQWIGLAQAIEWFAGIMIGLIVINQFCWIRNRKKRV